MKKVLFLIVSIYSSAIYSQTFDGNLGSKSLKWAKEQKDFNSPPRVGVDPMSIKLWDNYNGDHSLNAPSDFGSLLEISGQQGHLISQLYFDSTWNGSRILYRSAFYDQHTWESWRYLLDSKSDVETSGNLKIGGIGTNYISGNLGIGVSNPSNDQGWGRVLDVAGIHHSKILATSENTLYKVGIFAHNEGWYGGGGFVGTESNHSLHLITNYNVKMSILTNGNVGIGTTNPTSKLTVAGNIHAQEVKVTINAGLVPDYVFSNNYKLQSLQEIENYIKQNNHLPEIPSATEIEKNGLMLAEMNLSLLKKMEEMTLYIIEQNKQIIDLQTRLEKVEVASVK